MELFKASPDKADLYRYFAAHDLYNIDESQVTKTQRQVGKVAHLGLGFGAGGATFQKVAKLMGGVDMSLEEATKVVNTYRDAHLEIQKGWRTFQDSLDKIRQGTDGSIDPWGMCTMEKDAVRLPSGRRIYYTDLHQEQADSGKMEWWYGNVRTRARIYAGKGVENLVQALARDVIAEHAVKFFKATGLRPALMVHDELVYVVPEDTAEHQLASLQTIMRQGVSWWPELITWSEGDIASCYGEAK
jgi:DNA polymerase